VPIYPLVYGDDSIHVCKFIIGINLEVDLLQPEQPQGPIAVADPCFCTIIRKKSSCRLSLCWSGHGRISTLRATAVTCSCYLSRGVSDSLSYPKFSVHCVTTFYELSNSQTLLLLELPLLCICVESGETTWMEVVGPDKDMRVESR